MINALRAGAYGIPFMPVGGMWGSDLVANRPEFFQVMKSPFDGKEVVCVKALVPDYAIIHVQEADIYGNARILGPGFQDVLMSRAARKTIITTERIVGTYRMRENSKLTEVPYFTVEAVVELPGGAKPGICYPEYLTVDWDDHKSYLASVKAGEVPSFAEKMLKGRV
jgi:glutaconate CoA-transferase, subunit A